MTNAVALNAVLEERRRICESLETIIKKNGRFAHERDSIVLTYGDLRKLINNQEHHSPTPVVIRVIPKH
jgi:hypothetical protein